MNEIYNKSKMLLAAAAVTLLFSGNVMAQTPGTVTDGGVSAKTFGIDALTPQTAESGFIYLSIDGCGSTATSCTIDVNKPNGATVRKAFLATSRTLGSPIPDGVITVNGTPISWDVSVVNSYFDNSWKDITSLLKPTIDAAAPGITAVTIGEGTISSTIDGSVIAVVFDDPNQTSVSTAVLTFGGQALSGDTFSIGLADPFDDANQDIVMSLGISYGYQPAGQYSIVEVNGSRLTTSAGGYDDGEPANGALLTVGGLGDDEANPPDPNLTDVNGSDYDDELYTLDPLLADGATNISVFSQNPSNNDNIFFAAFLIRGTAAVIGEGITLGPTQSTNPVNTNHTVTATVQDDNGQPKVGVSVDFEIISGPNAGLTGNGTTDADGKADFTWSSALAGVDVVVARFTDSRQQVQTSNEARKEWIVDGNPCVDPSWDGNVTHNGTDAYLTIQVPGGIVEAELYNTNNLVSLGVYDASFNDITSDFTVTGSGGDVTYTYAGAGPAPEVINLKVDAVTSGTSRFFLRVTNDCTTIDIDPVITVAVESEVADQFVVHQNYPNPFANNTTIAFELANAENVSVKVYDVLGQLVSTVVSGNLSSGRHEVRWDGSNDAGARVSSGLYLYRVETAKHTVTRTMTLLN
ncbi:MAG: FlgD immunoglobulin-like domain containing protein [Rhodothermales bacterium]